MKFERYADILAQHGMAPFYREPWVNPRTERVEPRVLGERPAMRWRVSRDEWERLEAAAREHWGWTDQTFLGQSMLAGWPIDLDDALPPNSVVFEPVDEALRRVG